MNLPERLVINAIPWTVAVDDTPDPNDEGVTYPGRLEIKINIEVSEGKHNAIFWHELIHAILNSREINVKRQIKCEEDLARVLGPALTEFFEANADITWKEPPDVASEEKYG